ncbi:T9SS type A sorting domain-containing protein [uncultured Microscilla sp.]|uniref:T9SS type A sorting domain-containing protein n=1 Tax=uncultured Microscilla sp. TaxID=432653 RepID=UPI0026030246|nr:T9SS type A sorting domain-containing protein [uncultured Microscilla sp.]
MFNPYKTKILRGGVAKVLKSGAAAKITLTILTTTLLLFAANIALRPIPGNIGKINPAISFATVNEGESTTFSVAAVANATKYTWHVPAELNGGFAGVKETDQPEITLQAAPVIINTEVKLKVQAKSDFCTSDFSDDYPITIKPVGVKITPAEAEFCEGDLASKTLSIVLQETSKEDFTGQGTLTLVLSEQNFTLGGDDLKIMAKFQDSQGSEFQDLEESLQEKFEASITNESQLQLKYDFTDATFKSKIDQLKIQGLTVTPKGGATASTVFLRPQSVDELPWEGIYKNTDFGRFTILSKPTTVTNIEVFDIGNKQLRLLAVGANNATQYEWTLPEGVTPVSGSHVTTSSDVLVTYDPDKVPDLSKAQVSVTVKTASCEGELSDWVALSNVSDIQVNFQPIDTPLCVSGAPIVVPQHVVCTEIKASAFNKQKVAVELTSGFKLLAKPKVFFGEKGKELKEINAVVYTTDQRGIEFSLTGLEKDEELNQLEIRGVVVQAVEATNTNSKTLLRASGLVTNTVSLISFTRHDSPLVPVFRTFPEVVCGGKNATLSVENPQPNLTYTWNLPPGATITSPPKNAPEVTVKIGDSFKGGLVSVTAKSKENSCTSTSVSQTLSALPVAPVGVVIIEGKDQLFVDEESIYIAKDGKKAVKYHWTIPEGLKPASMSDVTVTHIKDNIYSTNEPKLSLKATKVVSEVDVTVRGVNACGDEGDLAAKKITSVQSQVSFVPATLDPVCAGAKNVEVGDITIKEVFEKDFKGKGSLVLTPKGGGVSLVEDDKNLVVKVDGVQKTLPEFQAKIQDGALIIDYNFDNDNAYSGINTMIVKGVKINLGNNLMNPPPLIFTTNSNQSTLNIGDSYVFAQINQWVSFDADKAVIQVYEEGNASTPLNALCTNNDNKTYTLKVAGITGADEYIWNIPADVFDNIPANPQGEMVTVTLKDKPNVGADNTIDITVQGGKVGSDCQSSIVSRKVHIFADFDANTAVGFTKSVTSICQKESEIKSLSVNSIEGATHYQWTLHKDLEALTPDEGGDASDQVVFTSGTTLLVKVKSEASLLGEGTPASISVKGVKMASKTSCFITTPTKGEMTNIMLYSKPGNLDIEGVTERATFAKNGADQLLEGKPAGGYFKLTKGIITKEDSDGKLKTYFSPSNADEGTNTITYVYAQGNCEFSVERKVAVSEETSTGLTAQCKTTTEEPLVLPTKTDDGWLLYAVIEELGINEQPVIVNDGAKNLDAPTPVLVTYNEAKALSCETPAIKDNISKIEKLNSYGNYHYKLNPSKVIKPSITIRAVYVKLGKTALIFDRCEDVKIVTMEAVEVLSPPTKPIIAPSFSAKICKEKQGVYQVSSPNPEYIYEWTIEEHGNLSGSPGYTFEGGISTGTSVSVNWTSPGTKKLTVIAKRDKLKACASEASQFIEVEVKEPFKASIKGSPIALDNQAIKYTVELEDAEGKVMSNIEDQYNFEWIIEGGTGTTNTSASNDITWSSNGKILVKVTEKAPGNTPDYIPLMCTQIATLKVLKTNLNSMNGCAIQPNIYQLQTSPDTPVDMSWTVENGTIKGGDNEGTSITTKSNEGIEVTWENIASGTIKTSIGKGATLYKRTFTVSIDTKPNMLELSQSEYKYCEDNDKVSLKPKEALQLPIRTLTFYEVIGNRPDLGNDVEIKNPNAYDPETDEETVYYVYTTPSGCKYTSKTAQVSKAKPTTVVFEASAKGVGIHQTGTIKGQDITFCGLDDDAEGELVFELTNYNSNSGGTFVITNDNTGQQVGDAIKVAKGNTSAAFDYSLFSAGGVFTITYASDEFCAKPQKNKIRVLARVPNLDIQLENESKRSFCVSNVTQYNFGVEQPANAIKHTGSFYIRKKESASLGYTVYDLTEKGFVEVIGFDPQKPIPNGSGGGGLNANAGQYEIVYVYQYKIGNSDEKYPCKYISDVLTITLERLPILTIEGLKETYCRNEAKGSIEVRDQGNKDNTSVLVLTQLEYKNGDQWRRVPSNDPTELIPSKIPYEIRATHTNNAGCTNVSDTLQVKVLSEPTDVRLFISKVYHEQAMHFRSTQTNTTEGWEWVINGSVTNTKETTYATKNNTGNISYSMTANIKACKKIVKKSFKLDFDFEGHFVGGTSTITNKSSLRDENGNDELGQVTWTIADKEGKVLETLNGANNPVNYSFATAGEYWITLTMLNKAHKVTYTLKRRVDIFDVITVTKGENYIEGFENGAKSWVSRGVVNQNQVFADKTSWTLKSLSNASQDIIKQGQGVVWMTDNGNKTHYYNNEQSYVESPCYDMSDLDKPMVSLRYWSHTDKGADGVALLYTVDDGKTWQKVGKKTPEIENWYNEQGILGAPGSSSDANANTENQGWTGADSTWRTTAYSLSNVRRAMLANNTSLVRFRIAFGSNGDNPSSQYEGFAFDDFSISNRNRTLLLEYFTNNGVSDAEALDKEVKFFPYNEDNTNTEIISIHHHVGFPEADALNEYNTKDVSGRAFYHGIKNAPMAIIDGLDTSRHPHNEISSLFYDQRVLSVSPFSIAIESPQVTNGKMKIKARVMALENFDRPIVIQVVVIEDEVSSQGKTYHHVMRKMLPDAAGTYYDHSWKSGDSYNLDLRPWHVGDLTMKSYRIVVFVEDYVTKEVHQAAVSAVQTLRQDEGQAGQEVTGLDKRIVKSGMLLFPNPASNEVQLKLNPNQQLKSQAAWEISNLNGQVVGSGVWPQHQRNIRVKVGHLSQGIYLFRVFDVERVFLLRFEKK